MGDQNFVFLCLVLFLIGVIFGIESFMPACT